MTSLFLGAIDLNGAFFGWVGLVVDVNCFCNLLALLDCGVIVLEVGVFFDGFEEVDGDISPEERDAGRDGDGHPLRGVLFLDGVGDTDLDVLALPVGDETFRLLLSFFTFGLLTSTDALDVVSGNSASVNSPVLEIDSVARSGCLALGALSSLTSGIWSFDCFLFGVASLVMRFLTATRAVGRRFVAFDRSLRDEVCLLDESSESLETSTKDRFLALGESGTLSSGVDCDPILIFSFSTISDDFGEVPSLKGATTRWAGPRYRLLFLRRNSGVIVRGVLSISAT